ncbi:hypothetical protein UB43_10890 [Pseudomonas sp. 21]|uniref:DUF2946 domain-containing protein n=1 Tax=unclassified Pseudomonas TaxID=196821 RepID=UPI00061F00EB|nr:DUF2946 domain-containing protein [Pseudomonas sp. 21]KJK00906.1 hypothetical protein UB43_10890 [Pseudomonas sp. 21]MBV7581796.1 DUF2946 domain-containing protein [Pseudomonas sp. PDM33]
MTRRTRQGVGTWLALFAMLMIYVGPLVSQSMPMDHAMPMDHVMPMEHGKAMDHGAAVAAMDEMACSEGHRAAAQQPALASHGEQPLTADAFMEKCGYCSLLIHSPPLTPPPVVLDHGVPAVGAPVALFTASRIPASPVFPGARSRAPPFLIG